MKKALRKELREKRASLENKEALSLIIQQSFLNSELYNSAQTLLLYSSTGSEVSTDLICRRALEDKKKVAFPLCLDGGGKMKFFYIKDENDLVEGMYGIKAPADYCSEYVSDENSLCVVPGLAFDKSGYRIGYGKGYYDRFLSAFDGVSVGLCFASMVADRLPTDAYDKKVSCLITDKTTYKFQ